MEPRDWLGLVLAALIGLLLLAIKPWSGLWLLTIALCVVIAAVLLTELLPKPDDTKFANFHVATTEVAFNTHNLNQMVANIYLQNDAGNADVVGYSATIYGPSTPEGDKQAISLLRDAMAKKIKDGTGAHYKIGEKETKWTSAVGGVMSDELKQKYLAGEVSFYFINTMVINENSVTKTLEYCGFVRGNSLNTIFECPSAS